MGWCVNNLTHTLGVWVVAAIVFRRCCRVWVCVCASSCCLLCCWSLSLSALVGSWMRRQHTYANAPKRTQAKAHKIVRLSVMMRRYQVPRTDGRTSRGRLHTDDSGADWGQAIGSNTRRVCCTYEKATNHIQIRRRQNVLFATFVVFSSSQTSRSVAITWLCKRKPVVPYTV